MKKSLFKCLMFTGLLLSSMYVKNQKDQENLLLKMDMLALKIDSNLHLEKQINEDTKALLRKNQIEIINFKKMTQEKNEYYSYSLVGKLNLYLKHEQEFVRNYQTTFE